jgi:sulfopyruvate decarboxylase subunit beta
MTTTMSKTDVIRTVIDVAEAAPIVFTTGYASRIAHTIAPRPSHFYMTGSMGLAAPIAAGVALATGRPAVAVDGDGALLMNPASLITAGFLDGLPLIHVVVDDGAYDSTGGQLSGSERIDACGWARACGYPMAAVVESLNALRALLAAHLTDRQGPALLHCKVARLDEPVPGRIGTDLVGYARRFAMYQRDAAGLCEACSLLVGAPESTVIGLSSAAT